MDNRKRIAYLDNLVSKAFDQNTLENQPFPKDLGLFFAKTEMTKIDFHYDVLQIYFLRNCFYYILLYMKT